MSNIPSLIKTHPCKLCELGTVCKQCTAAAVQNINTIMHMHYREGSFRVRRKQPWNVMSQVFVQSNSNGKSCDLVQGNSNLLNKKMVMQY